MDRDSHRKLCKNALLRPAACVVVGHVDGVGRAGLVLAGGGAERGEQLGGEDGADGLAGVSDRDDCGRFVLGV